MGRSRAAGMSRRERSQSRSVERGGEVQRNMNDWNRFCRYFWHDEQLGMRVDISRMRFADSLVDQFEEPMARAFAAMEAIEGGARANASEGRMVGHYWLRAPRLAPAEDIRREIEQTVVRIREFASGVHEGRILPQRGEGFFVVLVIGIGGSALGPQLLADCLGGADEGMPVLFMDNTDPAGIDRLLGELDESLAQTLTIVTSKSGGTAETRNAMLETAAAYKRAGLNFAQHAVAITADGSELHRKAKTEKWLATFPMWDWVGGRTSVTSAVGLLPAALQGMDIDAFLSGAAACDERTRRRELKTNPAALLALMWHYAGNGCGERNMVVLPYADRLLLLGRYLQQLVMESLGKSHDRAGREVRQGLTVFGNKGSTDQHAYVQQLRDGRNDFFVTFVQVLTQRDARSIALESDVTSADYLNSFLLGTREALNESGRESITLTLDRLDAFHLGALIALFERAVGLYAELINVNAYDQPGVEAGKKSAAFMLSLQREALSLLRGHGDGAMSCAEVAEALGRPEAAELIFHVLEHAAANPDRPVKCVGEVSPAERRYLIKTTH